MIVLLGASGYVGQAFARHLRLKGCAFTPLSRKQLDYTSYDALVGFLRETKPRFLINAAGFTGKPNVDACETARADTLKGNTQQARKLRHVPRQPRLMGRVNVHLDQAVCPEDGCREVRVVGHEPRLPRLLAQQDARALELGLRLVQRVGAV